MSRPHRRSTLFPYTTLFRSGTDTVTVDSLSVSGTTNIKTDTITTTGTQTYSDATTLNSTNGTSTHGTTNNDVSFGGATTLAGNLTVNAGSGSITFTGAVSGG